MGNRLRGVPQVLVVGAEGAGKTTLVAGEQAEDPEPTQGYNRIEKSLLDRESDGRKLSIWDVSGKVVLKPLWASYYKNIAFSALIFVIDSATTNLDQQIRDLHFLTNEEELRDAAFLVLFNMKNAKRETLGRNSKELGVLLRRHEVHLSTRIQFFEFDFKGYGDTARDALTWLYNNL